MEEYIKIVILAAVADGEFHSDEIKAIQKLKKLHPQISSITDEQAHAMVADIYNKMSAGIEPIGIIEQIGKGMNDHEKNIGYALAREICVSDFDYDENEKKFIKMLEKSWKIPKEVIDKIEFSINLRYFN